MAIVDCKPLSKYEEGIVRRAERILERKTKRASLTTPHLIRQLLAVRYAVAPREVFAAIFLDAQNQMIAIEELFHGTLTQTSVFPREVVRAALLHNAAGVVFVHNHPSGQPAPSHADRWLTQTLKQALLMVDVKTLDHFVVGGTATLSFAERGLMEDPDDDDETDAPYCGPEG